MTIEEALAGISKYRELVHKQNQWSTPGALSETMAKLATYNAYLADNIAPLHKEATDKAYRVFLRATGSGEPVTKAEQMSRGESTTERELYERAKLVYTATANMISIIQSRLRVIENQLKNEGKI